MQDRLDRLPPIELQHERFDRPVDVLQAKRPKLLEVQPKPSMHMVTHGSRNADSARWALSLEPRRHIHCVAMQISPVGDGITEVNPDTEADGSIGWLISVKNRNLPLYLHSTPHRPIDAVKGDQQRIAAGLHDPTAVFIDCWVDQVSAERTQTLEGPGVVQSDQATVANHVGINDGNQLPPI